MQLVWQTHFFLGLFAVLSKPTVGTLGRSQFYRAKVPSSLRKVLVEEVRFGVCPGTDINASSKNDIHLDSQYVDGAQNELILFNTLHNKNHNKPGYQKRKGQGTNDKGKKPAARFAPRYKCPSANKNAQHSFKNRNKDEQLDQAGDGILRKQLNDKSMGQTYVEAGPDRLMKIIGGGPAYVSWPWLVSVQFLGLDGEWHHFCGGSLIQSHWVVTAAHCVAHLEDYYIRVVLGDNILSRFSHREQLIDPDRIFMHKYFNQSTYDFDIALIKLQSNARTTKYVSTTEVATEEEVEHLDQSAVCYIAGWGNIVGSTSELFLSDQLQQSRMWIMPQALCQSKVSSTVSDSQICVYSEESSACKGDSGGPLMCSIDGDWLLVGAASFIVSPTCEPSSPNIYTRVSNYVYWMACVIQQYDADLFDA